MIQIHEFFKSLTRTNIPFLLWKQVSPFFSDLDNFLNVNLKIVICLTWGNCCQFGEWFLTAQIIQICSDSWKLIWLFQCFLYSIQIFAKVQNDEENEGAEAASGSSWWGMDYSSMLNKAVSSVSIATTAAALNAAELAKQKVRNWNSFQHYWQFRIHFHLELVFFSYP